MPPIVLSIGTLGPQLVVPLARFKRCALAGESMSHGAKFEVSKSGTIPRRALCFMLVVQVVNLQLPGPAPILPRCHQGL